VGEVEQILDNPRLIEAVRKKMGEDFRSGRLDPNRQGASYTRREERDLEARATQVEEPLGRRP
jgi:hypothetical protein